MESNKQNQSFPPIVLQPEEKERLANFGKGNNSKSALSIFESPYPQDKIEHQEQIFHPGMLNTLICRKIRPIVEAFLTKTQGVEYASSCWLEHAQRIIKAHMYDRYKERFKNVSNDEFIEKHKKQYPLVFQMLSEVSIALEAGKNINQIQAILGV